ncbi:cyclase family protein [Candidatus Kuenenbacteria bacterium]|nr:cyclase family protein [Candidatus Kuenenbacteria bacterium]
MLENSSNYIFLSHPIENTTPLYAGEKNISLKSELLISNGDSCNKMMWSFSNHTGTHVDAPLHFVDKGKSITDYNAGEWLFDNICLVELKDTSHGHIISINDLSNVVRDCELLIIKTGFEKHRNEDLYWQNSPGLNPELAEYLKSVCPSIRAVGFDFISVSSLSNRNLGRQAHKQFLSNNILLIEDMKLGELISIPQEIIVSPLIVDQADAAPCTIFAKIC